MRLFVSIINPNRMSPDYCKSSMVDPDLKLKGRGTFFSLLRFFLTKIRVGGGGGGSTGSDKRFGPWCGPATFLCCK